MLTYRYNVVLRVIFVRCCTTSLNLGSIECFTWALLNVYRGSEGLL